MSFHFSQSASRACSAAARYLSRTFIEGPTCVSESKILKPSRAIFVSPREFSFLRCHDTLPELRRKNSVLRAGVASPHPLPPVQDRGERRGGPGGPARIPPTV